MPDQIQFRVQSDNPPKVELSDAGLYIRFLSGVKVYRTAIQNEWPHLAVDLDKNGRVIGIEAVPAPRAFSIGKIPTIAASAGVGGLPRYKAADVQIENGCAA